jgi:hypothetical protein
VCKHAYPLWILRRFSHATFIYERGKKAWGKSKTNNNWRMIHDERGEGEWLERCW